MGRLRVVVGRHDLARSSDGESIRASREVVHPDYDDVWVNNDFLLIFLREAADESLAVIRLNPRDDVPESEGDPVTVMGWGDTDPDDDRTVVSENLKHVEVNYLSNEVCEDSKGYIGSNWYSYENEITDNMMCAQDRNEDACQGDSGKFNFFS